MALDFKFESAPPRTRGVGASGPPEEVRAADRLRNAPGREARVFTFSAEDRSRAYVLAQTVREGRRAAFGSGFTAVARSSGDTCAVYITYTGE